MEYRALYRKYRPKTFDEISGQEFIVKTLQNIIKNHKISHSYLFIGPRGTGKTSTAKIFAKSINCLNSKDGISCEKCDICLSSNKNENIDIIEMDAASNNGVDEIREIKNHITLMPTESEYKIYIIDEVHMLSQGAFNALLKTLEEPPKHIIFILATTDAQKVPLTIKSRCQNFEFKLLPKKVIKDRLKYICDEEKIKIDDETLEKIAELSKGGLRDAISLLDQLSSYTNGNITKDNVINLSGSIDDNEVEQFLNTIKNSNYEECFKIIDDLENSGKNFLIICESIIEYLKNEILKNKDVNTNVITKQIMNFNECINHIRNTSDKRVCFDLYTLKAFEIYKEEQKTKIKIEEKIVKKEKQQEKPKKEIKQKKEYDKYDELMKKRINNILINAKSSYKNEYSKILNELQTKVENLDDLKLVNLLMESNVRAGSEDGILVTVSDYNILEELYDNLFDIEKMINKLYNKNIKVCLLIDDFWLNERDNYVNKVKNKELKPESDEVIVKELLKAIEKTKDEFEDLLEIGE